MHNIHPYKAGLTLAILLGSWHLGWVILVSLGWAQWVINFVFQLHAIQPILVIDAFNISNAILLVGLTALLGFSFGLAFALLWNALQRQARQADRQPAAGRPAS